MKLTPVERLILLRLSQVLELIDPANAARHDRDAQALEQGTAPDLAGLFDVLDLEPHERTRSATVLRLVPSAN